MSQEMVRRVGFEPTLDFRHVIMSHGPPTVGRPSYYSLLHNVKTLYRSPSLNRSLQGSLLLLLFSEQITPLINRRSST